MNMRHFTQSSGFKVLAMARLSQCEYSVVLYLINCAFSGLDQVLTIESELASLIGYDERDLSDAIRSLNVRKMIRLRYSDGTMTTSENPSMRIGLEFEVDKWQLDFETDAHAHDAIVYPFRRSGHAALKVLEGSKKEKQRPGAPKETWARICQEFSRGRTLDEAEVEESEAAAKFLTDTHPVDQVLIFLKHFSLRIPSLSLLASSWQHYQELFESETQKVNLLDARQKHLELDESLRLKARHYLDKSDELELTEEDKGVLNILLKHRHPRRQLFWAFQLRSRYPKLREFFEENSGIMVPVTSAGTVIKRGFPNKET
jgi:predicted nucleic acid-binding protein